MPNSQSASEDQNEIRNASKRVVVVAARFALDEYRNYSAYICLPHRSFQQCVRMAFYTKTNLTTESQKSWGKRKRLLLTPSLLVHETLVFRKGVRFLNRNNVS